MKPKELELLIKLQPVIRKKMGELQYGDSLCCQKDGNRIFTWQADTHKIYPDDLVIPQAIDRDNPERGLLGMIEYFGELYKSRKDGWIYRSADILHLYYGGNSPYLALLKALCGQEGVEI